MSSDNDIFNLWNQQKSVDPPSISELVSKAQGLKNKVRNRLLGAGLLLSGTLIFIAWTLASMSNLHLTTKIGVGMMMAAIVLGLGSFINAILHTFKFPINVSGKDCLEKMISLRHKQRFIQRTIMSIYFLLLSIGVFLYMLEFILKMETLWAIVAYALTAAWFAFAWFYLRPKAIKKQEAEISRVIEELEKINEQLK